MRKLVRWEYACLCLLVIVNLAIHFSIINNPPTVVFDEVYYAADGKTILEEHTTNRGEHPPLGKLFFAAGIALLGDNAVGWRTLPIISGTINIVLLYLICRRLKMSRLAANTAAFLLTFENMSFVLGGIAMLDVFSLTFMLLSFWLYLRGNYPLSAVSVALAALAKLNGVFAIPIIFLHWLIARRKESAVHFVASMSLAPLGYLLLTPVFEFLIFLRPTNFIYHIQIMLTQSASLTFATTYNPYLIRPWEFAIIPYVIPYGYNPHYFGAISFTVWAFIIPAFAYMIFRAVKGSEAGLFGVLWFAATYLVWILISLTLDRVSYIHYFYPAIGAICLGLGMGVSEAVDRWGKGGSRKSRWMTKGSVAFFLLLHLIVFAILAPVNPWPVENLFM